jgi:hypothetical protein
MSDLLASSNDTPTAALKRGQDFWRYQRTLSTTTATAPYAYLGQINPAAIVVGPASWLDSYRLWYIPPSNPGVAYYQDFSVGAPVTTPVNFYTNSVVLNGNTMRPGLYVYFGINQNCYSEGFAGSTDYYPLAPRWLPQNTVGVATAVRAPVTIDLIVYFKQPPTLPVLRAPINNSYISPKTGGDPEAAERFMTLTFPYAAPEQIWGVPGYGRKVVNWSINSPSGTLTWAFRALMFGTATSAQTRIIATGTTAANVPSSYLLAGASFDWYELWCTGLTVSGDVAFTFEAADS